MTNVHIPAHPFQRAAFPARPILSMKVLARSPLFGALILGFSSTTTARAFSLRLTTAQLPHSGLVDSDKSFSSTAIKMSLSIPPEQIPPGMKAVRVGSPFLHAAMEELSSFGSKKVFVLANRSSAKFLEGGDGKFVDSLRAKGMLAAPLFTSIGMGGGEEGLLSAADDARAAEADVVVTVGGGAVQDAGKLIRLWLSADAADGEKATVKGIQAASNRDPMPALPPQIAMPNSFAMAEATHVAGITLKSNTKSGAAHKCLMPTVVIYDPALSAGLPDWVRFGTALRGVEHAVGAVTHPKADDDIRARALNGLTIINENLRKLVDDPENQTLQSNIFVGGFIAIRALNTGCYPALGHLVENQYSAKFDVHQGSCSGILCARVMAHHAEKSEGFQKLISAALGDDGVPAPRLVRDLAATLPGVKSEHADVGVNEEMLKEFTKWMFETSVKRYNNLSPKDFGSKEDIYEMMTKSLAEL